MCFSESIVLYLRSKSDTDVHVLHDQVSRAVVNKPAAKVLVGEEGPKLAHETLLAVIFENDILVRLNDAKALVKNIVAVLLAHESLELRELAGRNVNHLVFADVASHITVLALVVVSRRLGGGLVLHISGLLERRNVLLVPVVAHFGNVASDLRALRRGVFC